MSDDVVHIGKVRCRVSDLPAELRKKLGLGERGRYVVGDDNELELGELEDSNKLEVLKVRSGKNGRKKKDIYVLCKLSDLKKLDSDSGDGLGYFGDSKIIDIDDSHVSSIYDSNQVDYIDKPSRSKPKSKPKTEIVRYRNDNYRYKNNNSVDIVSNLKLIIVLVVAVVALVLAVSEPFVFMMLVLMAIAILAKSRRL